MGGEFPRFYDGPKLAAWLEERGCLGGHPRGSFARTVMRWRSGVNPAFDTVDRWLVPLGLHLNEIPDECASEGRKRSRAQVSPRALVEARQRALRLIAEGYSSREAAQVVGVHDATVRRWRRKANAAVPVG